METLEGEVETLEGRVATLEGRVKDLQQVANVCPPLVPGTGEGAPWDDEVLVAGDVVLEVAEDGGVGVVGDDDEGGGW